MNFLEKLVRADRYRLTRFHDQQGNFLPTEELNLLPRRLSETLSVKLGRFPKEPWWPAAARRKIEGLLDPAWRVVEFGSGMSTEWLALRVGEIISVEDNIEWQSKVLSSLAESGAVNATVLHRNIETYLDIEIDSGLDLVIVDGHRRKDCVVWALSKLRPGGFLYLDNSDRTADGSRAELLAAGDVGAADIEFFRGIPPGLFAVTEGALARLRP